MTVIYGATASEWRQLQAYPVLHGCVFEMMCAPESVIPAGTDTMKRERGKVPSRRNDRGLAVGIAGWTTRPGAGLEDLQRWEKEADTDAGFWRGAFLKTGYEGVFIIDCDEDDPERSQRVLNLLASMTGVSVLSVRRRSNSAHWQALMRISDGPSFRSKVVIKGTPVKGENGLLKQQAVECISSGFGAALFGTHPSGARYEWTQGLQIYTVTRQQFEDFRDAVHDVMTEGLSEEDKIRLIDSTYDIHWADSEPELRNFGSRAMKPADRAQLCTSDPGVAWLTQIGWPVLGYKADGGIRVKCPNWKQHTNGDVEAVYYPAGHPLCPDTGGYRCLHAHCAAISRRQFLTMIRELPEFRNAPEPSPLCYITRPAEIQWSDESEAAAEGAAKLKEAQEERKASAEERQKLSVTEADSLGSEETGETAKQTWKGAIEALQRFRKRDKKTGEPIEPAVMVNTSLSLETACKFPILTGMDVRFDTYRRRVTVREYGTTDRKPLEDTDYTQIMVNLEANRYGRVGFINPGRDSVVQFVNLTAKKGRYDDLAEFVKYNVPKWDGVPRIDTMFTEHFHAKINKSAGQTEAFYSAAARYFMLAMVKRAISPDTPIKADDILVLKGAQGCRKSTAVRCLALRDTDCLEGLTFANDDTEWAIRISGHIIAEIPEMSGYSRRDVAETKSILSRTEDSYRPKYEKVAVTVPRRCMVVLTTNEPEFLTDVTGNRRFLIIEIADGMIIDTDWIRSNIYQLWAEALHLLEAGDGYIPQTEAEIAGAVVAENFLRADPLEESVCNAARRLLVSSKDGVSVRDIISQIGSGTGLLPDMKGEKRVADILRLNGWHQVRMREGERRLRRWRYPEASK